MTRRRKSLRCLTGLTDEQITQAVADGLVTQHDADAVRNFREFLRHQADTIRDHG